jgi:hypothetical protein
MAEILSFKEQSYKKQEDECSIESSRLLGPLLGENHC